MIIVRVNRDSVSPGDDFESHAEQWEFDGEPTFREVVLHAMSGYLPEIWGEVAWMMQLETDAHTLPIAAVHRPHPGVVGSEAGFVLPLNACFARPIPQIGAIFQQPTGVWNVRFRYVSAGRLYDQATLAAAVSIAAPTVTTI